MLVGDTETDRNTGLAAGVPVALVTFGPEGRGVTRLSPEARRSIMAELPSRAGLLNQRRGGRAARLKRQAE